jgi:hypothetical protein
MEHRGPRSREGSAMSPPRTSAPSVILPPKLISTKPQDLVSTVTKNRSCSRRGGAGEGFKGGAHRRGRDRGRARKAAAVVCISGGSGGDVVLPARRGGGNEAGWIG